MSFPRRRESRPSVSLWIPACAGTSMDTSFRLKRPSRPRASEPLGVARALGWYDREELIEALFTLLSLTNDSISRTDIRTYLSSESTHQHVMEDTEMTESPIREKKSVRTLGRIFKTIVSAFCVLCVAGLLLFMTLPITSLPLSEHNPIVTGQRAGAFVGHWETNQQNGTYALFPDGREMLFVSSFFWTFASPLRYELNSPYYQKNPDDSVCHIIHTRTSLAQPFERSCQPIRPTQFIQHAFADGHQRFMDIAQNAKRVYEQYRTLGLVE